MDKMKHWFVTEVDDDIIGFKAAEGRFNVDEDNNPSKVDEAVEAMRCATAAVLAAG
jgi:hypothetical protein